MGGFLGFGTPGSVTTDRNQQLKAQGNLNNVFNYALPQSQGQQQAGQGALGEAQNYYSQILNAGRQQTAQMAAPAINAQVAQGDTATRQAGAQGTNRTGGATNAQAERQATQQGTIDNLLNSQMAQQKQQGAQGLAQTGGTQLANAASLLGLGAGTQQAVMSDADQSRKTSEQIAKEGQGELGQTIGTLLTAGAGLFGF